MIGIGREKRMEILIDIPEHQYNNIMAISSVNLGRSLYKGVIMSAVHAIQKGTVLPKGHGRLIDADELYGDFIDGTEGYDSHTWNRIEIGDIIEEAPTIIEADMEGENKE